MKIRTLLGIFIEICCLHCAQPIFSFPPGSFPAVSPDFPSP